MKTFQTEFRKFYRKGRFSKKRKNLSQFQRLATSGHYNYAMITNCYRSPEIRYQLIPLWDV